MLSFLSSVVAAPLPLSSSEPSSETTDNGRRYLLIGQGDVVVGKEDKNSVSSQGTVGSLAVVAEYIQAGRCRK